VLKDAIVNLSLDHGNEAVVRYAVSVASTFSLHLTGVAFAYEAIAIGSPFEGATASLVAAGRQESRKRADTAAKYFESIAKSAAITSESHIVDASLDDACAWLAGRARHHDVCIIAQPNPDRAGPETLLTEAALFASGRPVLVVPYIQKSPMKLDRIAVCWNDSVSAARAIHDALPFLQHGKALDLICVSNSDSAANGLKAVDMAAHLTRHGLRVQVVPLSSADISVADTVLSYGADNEIDFLVMGGYGHSRMREYVLGGMTHDILKTMTMPVLMSH
jgi:nucleotide-binding universal stress UspA family protein